MTVTFHAGPIEIDDTVRGLIREAVTELRRTTA